MHPLYYLKLCLSVGRPCLPARWHKTAPNLKMRDIKQGHGAVYRAIRYRGRRYWLAISYTQRSTDISRMLFGGSYLNATVSTTRPDGNVHPAGTTTIGAMEAGVLKKALAELRAQQRRS